MTIEWLAGNRIRGTDSEKTVSSVAFTENFANADEWTQTGSDITIASNQLTWIGDRQNASHGIHHDMGANVVNTSAWTLEFDLILDNYSAGTTTYTHQLGVMMTNVDSSVGTLGSNATRDFIGMSLNWRTDTASQQRKFYAKDDNGSTDTWSDNSPANTPDDSTSQGFPTAGTTYHIKIIRTSATVYKIEIWNSDESSLLDTLNGACSNTSDLRYILVQKYGTGADGNPSFDGKIDNMEFTHASSINVPDGSIFYTTDTNKEYILSNNTWTEV